MCWSALKRKSCFAIAICKPSKVKRRIALTDAAREVLQHTGENQKLSQRIISTDKARLKKAASEFDYDIALSYASEDRPMVEQVADSLKQRSVKVFYDQFEQAQLWGTDLYSFLIDIYMRAKYCVMFISRHYAESCWTSHELRAAQATAFNLNAPYILPVRLDNTVIQGVLPTTSFVECYQFC